MVLKIVNRKVVLNKDAKVEGEVKVDRFFDGFHNVIVEDCRASEMEPAAYCFVADPKEAGASHVKKITLVSKHSVETIYADFTYEIYLMSDIGKTIEKLN